MLRHIPYNLKIATTYLNCSKAEKKEKISKALEKVGLNGYEKKRYISLVGESNRELQWLKLY